MSLVTVEQVKLLVGSNLPDEVLQDVIDRVEAEVVRMYGAHYSGSLELTETLEGGEYRLFVRRPISTLTSVVENDEALTVDDDFKLEAEQGNLLRLPLGSTWGWETIVKYKPVDDSDQRREVILDLVRVTLERTAMRRESEQGVYSYEAPDWEAERATILRRLRWGLL